MQWKTRATMRYDGHLNREKSWSSSRMKQLAACIDHECSKLVLEDGAEWVARMVGMEEKARGRIDDDLVGRCLKELGSFS